MIPAVAYVRLAGSAYPPTSSSAMLTAMDAVELTILPIAVLYVKIACDRSVQTMKLRTE